LDLSRVLRDAHESVVAPFVHIVHHILRIENKFVQVLWVFKEFA